ncbi:hypothetical protein QE152_g5752 [Popillia japonica]|uniref:Uncharacterized protein n=1 Tax=Popillia japonica TaxID=7064 RepID=A0AAW1MGN9_POPJA
MDFDAEDDIPLSELANISNLMVLSKFDEYVSIDENLEVTEQLSDVDLVRQAMEEPQQEEHMEDDKELEREETAITTEDAITSIRKLQRYFQQTENNTDTISILNKVELILNKDYLDKPWIQTKLTNFFQNM